MANIEGNGTPKLADIKPAYYPGLGGSVADAVLGPSDEAIAVIKADAPRIKTELRAAYKAQRAEATANGTGHHGLVDVFKAFKPKHA